MSTSNFNSYEVERTKRLITDWLGGKKPTVALTLGSGLGGFGHDFPGATEANYNDFWLPTCLADGHAGKLRFVEIGHQGVLIFDGRAHLYEGRSFQEIVLGVRAAYLAGAKTQIITCASGGVNPKLKPGELVIIGDHLNKMGGSPLTGMNHDQIGKRFPDMTNAYDPELQHIAHTASHEISGVKLNTGVYAAMPGPSYETPAEVRMLRAMGADMAGMSTVPEVIALRHLGARVLGISCVTNHAAGVIPNQTLSHDEVVKEGATAAPRFRALIIKIIEMLPAPAT